MYHYYEVLNVSRDADEAAIRRAYHRQSLRLHPDKPTGSTEAFQELDRAHKVLADEKRRARYDLLGLDLQERKSDSVDAQVFSFGLRGTRLCVLAALRTSLGGLFVVLLPQYRPVCVCQGVASLAVYGAQLVHRYRQVDSSSDDEPPLDPSAAFRAQLWRKLRGLGGKLTALFAAGWVAHQTSAGRRFVWLYEAGVLFTTFRGFSEDDLRLDVRASPRTLLAGHCVGCLLAAFWLGRRPLRWILVVFLQMAASAAAPALCASLGKVAGRAAEAKLMLYARAVREAVEDDRARGEGLRRRVEELELAVRVANAKLERHTDFTHKAAERREEHRRRQVHRVVEFEGGGGATSSRARR